MGLRSSSVTKQKLKGFVCVIVAQLPYHVVAHRELNGDAASALPEIAALYSMRYGIFDVRRNQVGVEEAFAEGH